MFDFADPTWKRDAVDLIVNGVCYGLGAVVVIGFALVLLESIISSFRKRPKETPVGAHSSLMITRTQARKIWQEEVVEDSPVSLDKMEEFFDMATDEVLHNVCIVHDETDRDTQEYEVARYVRQYLENNPDKRPKSLKYENGLLRGLLAIRVAGVTGLYTDDGELMDSTEVPVIDFKRDSAEEIRRKLVERSVRRAGGNLPT